MCDRKHYNNLWCHQQAKVNWENMTTDTHGVDLVECAMNPFLFFRTQQIPEPTREDAILNLVFRSDPDKIQNINVRKEALSGSNDSHLLVVELSRGRSFIWQIEVNSSIQDRRQVDKSFFMESCQSCAAMLTHYLTKPLTTGPDYDPLLRL